VIDIHIRYKHADVSKEEFFARHYSLARQAEETNTLSSIVKIEETKLTEDVATEKVDIGLRSKLALALAPELHEEPGEAISVARSLWFLRWEYSGHVYTCTKCPDEFYTTKLQALSHAYCQHGTTESVQKVLENDIVCQLCGREVPEDPVLLHNHMRAKHGISLWLYHHLLQSNDSMCRTSIDKCKVCKDFHGRT